MDEPKFALPDWAYPAEDEVPETLLHNRLRDQLRNLVEHHLARRGVRALTGSDQFVYYVEGNPQRAVSPDVYVVLGEDPRREVRIWQTWVEGRAPDLAIEIVSDDVHKDYVLGPARYAMVGVRELVVFDPLDGPSRVRWQVFQRDDQGELVVRERSNEDRVHSAVLECHLRWLPDSEEGPLLRLGEGPGGEDLVPTALEEERAATARERAEMERERARRRELEAEIAELRARLARGEPD